VVFIVLHAVSQHVMAVVATRSMIGQSNVSSGNVLRKGILNFVAFAAIIHAQNSMNL
jgi:hypothetical protein